MLAKPRADATFLDIFVEEGEIFQISEKRVGNDGVEYLKLLNHDGWIQGDTPRARRPPPTRTTSMTRRVTQGAA